MKVALFLEEAGLPYEFMPIDISKGEQHNLLYKAINPNAKTPSLIDGSVVVFDSNAILLYLAEKTGKFIPQNTPEQRAEMYSWLMFIATGIGPYSGQAIHFKHYAPEPKAYAVNRYDYEAWRHWEIIDTRLSKSHYMLGNTYTIIDMALWGWGRIVPFILGENAWEKLPHLKRLIDEINAHPAAVRAEALKTRHAFANGIDENARNIMFPGNKRLDES